MPEDFLIRKKEAFDADTVERLMAANWGGEPLVINCRQLYPSSLPGLLMYRGESLIGCIIYEQQKDQREIIVFEVGERCRGLGSRLLREFLVMAENEGCRRVHLMTTNDNLDALRFYQRRGFTLCGIRVGACIAGRKIKPSLEEIGDYGIPIRDEILLEMRLPMERG